MGIATEDSQNVETGAPLPKADPILNRRQQLVRQRRNRFLKSLWRTGAIFGGTLALGWGLMQPEWKIREPGQVRILGNTQLSRQSLSQIIPITYPSSLMRVEPRQIIQQLKRYAHVDQVTVSRQLLPPQVEIVVQERTPVAKTRCASCILAHNGQTPFLESDWWLIDRAGVAMPLSSYPALEQSLPELEVKGYLLANHSTESASQKNTVMISPKQQKQLQTILPRLLESPVSVTSLDWRDPNNLKIDTHLGHVHLAQVSGDPDKLTQQLQALDKLRSLPNEVDLTKIAFLDLSDPKYPNLVLKAKSNDSQQINLNQP